MMARTCRSTPLMPLVPCGSGLGLDALCCAKSRRSIPLKLSANEERAVAVAASVSPE